MSCRPVKAARISSWEYPAAHMVQIFARLVGVVFGAIEVFEHKQSGLEVQFFFQLKTR